MKKGIAFLALGLIASTSLQAQDAPEGWTSKSVVGLNFSETGLTNWSAGGENAVSWNVYLNANANYKRGHWSWDNALITDFGKTYTSTNNWQKSVDKLNISSKVGYSFAKHWSASFLADFLTQFGNGYASATDRGNGIPPISKFLAPGYLTLSLGADYKPNEHFSLFMSPLAGKLTFVNDTRLSNAGAYGVTPGKKLFAELGATLVANYNQEVCKNVLLNSKLTLFTAYTHDFGNVDIAWDVMLNFKINKYLTANITTNLVYDDDIKYGNGGPKVQFRRILGLGLVHTF